MPYDDLVFVDQNYKIVGWLIGIGEEQEKRYRQKYKLWTYGHFCNYWKGQYESGYIQEKPFWAYRED